MSDTLPGGAPEAAAVPSGGVAVAVLGELMVLVDGRPPSLRRKDRAVIAYLAITGRPQRRSTLIDLFFQEAGDPGAALRLLLARIRSQLGPRVLRSGDQQVALDPAAYWLDLRLFEKLLGQDSATSPHADLAAAVALVRGALLDRLHLPSAPEFDLWLLGERARVQHRVAQALQRLSDEAAAGHEFDAAIGYARALVAASPLREDAHARLIRLYTQTGQRTAALAQFEQCREILRRELAAAPGRTLIALREAISAGNTDLDVAQAAPSPPPAAPPASAGFYEREQELARLHALWRQARGGQGAVVVLIGEAGTGKSRLLREFVRSFTGSQLQLGACSELTRQIPYEPWVELLEGRLSADALRALPRLWRAYLLRLLPGLAAQVAVEIPPPPPTAGDELERLFAAVAEVLLPASYAPQVVAIEDLHWADPASLQLFGYLARRVSERAALLVGSLRTQEASEEPVVQTLLDGLQRIGATPLRLAPLSEPAVISLAARFVSQANASEVGGQVWRATGGNALFVTEVLRELASHAAQPSRLPIPSSVRELVGRQLARITEGERQVLEALAVLNTAAGLDEVADVSARGVDEVASALDAGLHWGLLVSDPSSAPGPYRFSHDLPREAVVSQLSLARRQILHRRVAERLERGAAAQPYEARLAIAERLLHHAQAGDAPELVLRWALPAAERAASVYAYTQALQKIDLGLAAYERLRAAGGEQRYRSDYIELLLRRILALDEIGQGYPAMSQHLDDVAAALTPETPEFLRTLYSYCRAVVLECQPNYALAIDENLQAHDRFVQLGELRLAAACLLRASSSMRTISRNQDAYATANRALAIYRSLDDPDGELACRYALGWLLINLGRYQEASSQIQEMLDLASAQQSLLGEARAHYLLGIARHSLYQGQPTVHHMQQAMERFKRLDIPGMAARCLLILGAGLEVTEASHSGSEGDFSQASATYAECWRQAHELADHWLSGWAAQLIGRRAFWDGDLATARLWLERATSIRRMAGELANQRNDLAWMGRLTLAEGDAEGALALTTRAVTGLAETSQEFYVWETPDLYLVHAQALAATGNRPAAEQALARAEAELLRAAEQIQDDQQRQQYLAASPLAQRIRAGLGEPIN